MAKSRTGCYLRELVDSKQELRNKKEEQTKRRLSIVDRSAGTTYATFSIPTLNIFIVPKQDFFQACLF
jgi:hypothetical protein